MMPARDHVLARHAIAKARMQYWRRRHDLFGLRDHFTAIGFPERSVNEILARCKRLDLSHADALYAFGVCFERMTDMIRFVLTHALEQARTPGRVGREAVDAGLDLWDHLGLFFARRHRTGR